MNDSTPINVPEELRPLVNQHPEVLEALRSMRIDLERLSGIDEPRIELIRIGAAIGLGAPEATFISHVRRAVSIGVTADEIWGVVLVVAPLVGVPRLLEAIPAIAVALEEPK
jgi:alkylhydroperoxidase/carboxymuconolactone decarboxylase family protein YurZ